MTSTDGQDQFPGRDYAYDDEWWQVVKEAHFTWASGDFLIRIGKQRVSWGEMDYFAVNDIVAPLDYARAYGDVELETLLIPIPLLRMDYYPPTSLGFIQNIALQFVFNPNVDHIPQNGAFFWLGNDAAGVWALDYPGPEFVNDTVLGVGVIDRPTLERAAELFDPTGAFGLLPAVQALPTLATTRFGRWDLNLEEPDNLESDFFEYGFKVSSTVGGSLFSLMAFYGREDIPTTTPGEAVPADSMTTADDAGNLIMTLLDRGFYPRQKFVGAAWAGLLPFLRIPTLGGVEPVLRIEARYQFDKTYFNTGKWLDEFLLTGASNFKSNLVKSDLFVAGINFEYKIKAPWQRAYFFFLFEANYNDILDHQDSWGVGDKSWWNYYFYMDTGYFRAKLRPSFSWYSEADGDINMLTPGLEYIFNEKLSVLVKGNFFGNSDFVGNKDNVVFKVTYQF